MLRLPPNMRFEPIAEDRLATADRTATQIIERFFRPKLSSDEMRQLMLTRADDPLEEFSAVCRLELRTLQRSI